MSKKESFSERGKFTDGDARPRESEGRLKTRHNVQDALDALERADSALTYVRELEARQKARKANREQGGGQQGNDESVEGGAQDARGRDS